MEIFIGGAGDDLAFLGLGVMAGYARRYAARTGAPVLYVPNARLRRVRRAIRQSGRDGVAVNLIGHSWGALDAWRAAAWAARHRLPVRTLITLDPVGGPMRRRFDGSVGCVWLNVEARPSRPDRSDILTRLPGLARKPSGLPVASATHWVSLDVNHRDVESMMIRSAAQELLEAAQSANRPTAAAL